MHHNICLLYTSDAADERSSVDLGGRRIIKKKNNIDIEDIHSRYEKKKQKSISQSTAQATREEVEEHSSRR